MTKNIYILSGLGADERFFQKLDFPGYKIHFVNWIKENENESLAHYSKRILKQIPTPKPILIGLSFGGIVAIEIAKLIETDKLILLASVKTKNEIPFYYRLGGKLKIHKILPSFLLKRPNFISNWLFGTKNKSEKELLKSIMKNAELKHVKWAIDKIVSWKNTEVPENLIHIHGTSDRVLPFRFVNKAIPIKKAGHFMTLNRSGEINKIILEELRVKNILPS